MTTVHIVLSAIVLGLIAIALIGFIIFGSRYMNLKIRSERENLVKSFEDQTRSINALLNLIDEQISLEVGHKLREEMTTSKDYDYLKIDTDCAAISQAVFDKLNPLFIMEYNDRTPIVTPNFWLDYIVKKTTLTMLGAVNTSRQQ